MEIRERLISDIKAFLATLKFKEEKIYLKPEYLDLDTRIFTLNEDVFESEEKYSHFLRYINQTENQTKRLIIAHFSEEQQLLIISNFFRRLIGWLK